MDFPRLQRLIGPRAAPPRPFTGLADFIRWTSSAIGPWGRSADWVPWLLDASCAAAAEDGIKVLELSIDSNNIRAFPRLDDLLFVVESLFRKWAPSLRLKPEIGFKKGEDPRDNAALLDGLISSGLFRSIDLYGNEILPASWPGRWAPVYRRARKAGLKLKAHLGETEGPFLLLHAARTLDLDSVQHGVAFARSRRLLSWARERDLCLNVCPASNIALGAAAAYGAHPMRILYDSGIRISLNSDDLVGFGATVSEQYLALAGAGAFSPRELDAIRRMGLEEGARG